MTPTPYPTEAQEQAALIKWTQAVRAKYPELALLYHAPNEGKRSSITGARLKQQGMKKGFPDLFLPVARGEYRGLFIEMKSLKGRTTPEQIWWLDRLSAQGYFATVCRGCEEAKITLEWYLTQ